MDHYEVNNPSGVAHLMGHLSRYVDPSDHQCDPTDFEQWHLWREYSSVDGKLILKPGTLWWHKDAAWKVPLAFVAVVERVQGSHLRFAVVIPPLEARISSTGSKKNSAIQWVQFTSRAMMLDAPPTEAQMQTHLCFRPAAAEVVDGLPPPPVLPSYDIMPSDRGRAQVHQQGNEHPKSQVPD